MIKGMWYQVVLSISVLMMAVLIQTSNADVKRCIEKAGKYYGINPRLLLAIAYVESGFNHRAVNVNKNGSRDFGMFQINEKNLKSLKIPVKVAFDPCKSSYIAGYILKQCVNIFGYTWKAIDCYNKGHKAKGYTRYVQKVIKAYRRLR